MICVQKMSSQRLTRFQRRLEEAAREEQMGRGRKSTAGRRGRNPLPPPVDPAPAHRRRRVTVAAAQEPPAADDDDEVDSDPEVEETINAEEPPCQARGPGTNPPPAANAVGNPPPTEAPQVGGGPLPPPPDLAGMYERQTLVMERMVAILEQGQGQLREIEPQKDDLQKKIVRFMRLKPPTFDHSTDPLEADDWLDVM